jgi:hypothetical protein
MAIIVALVVIGVAGSAAYMYLRASQIATGGEERFAFVFGVAFALVLRPESPVELVAELVAISIIVLGLASIAHLAAVTFRDRRAAGTTG